ncbi:hypothetical protein F5Y18DRAFT_423339 [Xylariaceae sp. FL1019]|nr:hypothetical protein F5Y18DRAFT_423339 [Xylariaceae sp. FL1019]
MTDNTWNQQEIVAVMQRAGWDADSIRATDTTLERGAKLERPLLPTEARQAERAELRMAMTTFDPNVDYLRNQSGKMVKPPPGSKNQPRWKPSEAPLNILFDCQLHCCPREMSQPYANAYKQALATRTSQRRAQAALIVARARRSTKSLAD